MYVYVYASVYVFSSQVQILQFSFAFLESRMYISAGQNVYLRIILFSIHLK